MDHNPHHNQNKTPCRAVLLMQPVIDAGKLAEMGNGSRSRNPEKIQTN